MDANGVLAAIYDEATRALRVSATSGDGAHLDPAQLRGLLDHAGPPIAGDLTGGAAVGDLIVDSAGRMWSATVAGDPGTWVDLSSGRELAYAEIASFAGASTTEADVTGLSVTPTVGTRPIKIILDGQAVRNGTANTTSTLIINSGTTDIAYSQLGGAAYSAAMKVPLHREVRIASPVAGTTYKVSYLVSAGTMALDSAFIQAVEC